jgi:hypothetical protein
MGSDRQSKAVLALKDGFIKGLKTGLFLLRIMVPIYLIVVVLRYTPAIPFLQEKLAPVMGVFHLPGDAAVPLVTGIFSDEYGVVAAMSGFDFTSASITTIAMISLCFHTIPLEAALGHSMGFHPGKYTLYRLVLAIATGLFIGWLAWATIGGGADADTGVIGGSEGSLVVIGGSGEARVFTAPWWAAMLAEMLHGTLSLILSLARVIIPLMIVIEYMLSYRLVEKVAPKLGSVRRLLGISQDALLPLLVGLLMGVSYGAGTLMEINKRTPLSPRDMTLIGVFLYACHGIIETTILFAVAGGNALFFSVIRLAIAVIITAVAARLPFFARDGARPEG